MGMWTLNKYEIHTYILYMHFTIYNMARNLLSLITLYPSVLDFLKIEFETYSKNQVGQTLNLSKRAAMSFSS